MAALLLGLWASFEALDFARGAHWGPPLVALGLLPLAWTMRSRVLAFFALASLFAVVFFATFPDLEELAVIVAFLTGLSFLMAGLALPASPFPGAAAPARVLGFVIYLGFLYVLGFEDAAEVLEDAELDRWLAVAYFAVPLALAIAAAALAFRRGRAGLGPWFGHWLAALVSILLVAGLTPAGIQGIELPVAIACNLLFLAHCLVFIQQGCRHADVVQVSVACVMLAALVLARYVDLFESLLVRSAVFLLLGAALFGIGMLYARAKRRLAETPA
jgi:hypothetical protein